MWSSIITILVDIYKTYNDKKTKDTEKLSKVFSKISDVIDSCIELLNNDTYPHNYCEIMASLSSEIVNELQDYLDFSKLVELESLLLSCSRLELEYANRKDENVMIQLNKASAKFRSLSILYS
jgi:hypothetical protein